jgi:hypothetical protein
MSKTESISKASKSDSEKHALVTEIEDAHSDTTGPDGLHRPKIVDEKKLIRKLDFRIVPWMSLLYLLSFMDRGSIGNAKVSLISWKLLLLKSVDLIRNLALQLGGRSSHNG